MHPWPELAPYACQYRLPGSGLTLHLYNSGSGPAVPLVFIHGLGDEADTWRHLFIPLAAGRRTIAVDLPGFGRSDKPSRAYTLDFFQATLEELLDNLELPRVSLVGHSLGAAIAQAFTLAHPERVERLGLIGGSLVAQKTPVTLTTLLFLVPGLGEWMYTRLRRDPQAAYRSLEPYYAHLERLPEAEKAFLFQRVNARVWDDGQRRAFLSTLRSLARRLPALQRGLAQRLADLTTPTLAIWGQADRINPPVNGQALAVMQPSTRLVLIPDAGHNVHQEQPISVLAELQSGI